MFSFSELNVFEYRIVGKLSEWLIYWPRSVQRLCVSTYQNLFLKVVFWTCDRADTFLCSSLCMSHRPSGSYFITLRLVYSHAETRSHLTWVLWQLHKARQIFKGDPTGLFFSSMDMLLWNCPAVHVVSGIHWQAWALPQECTLPVVLCHAVAFLCQQHVNIKRMKCHSVLLF